ncbi:MAG: hypothetical protein JRC68_09925 [Deltaproteobacteria bacterium]|nr:hypothetical protein [Deltaproteobacteria bacterium]
MASTAGSKGGFIQGEKDAKRLKEIRHKFCFRFPLQTDEVYSGADLGRDVIGEKTCSSSENTNTVAPK